MSISKFSDGFLVFHLNKETNSTGSNNRLSDIYNKVIWVYLCNKANLISFKNIQGWSDN